jgi:general secretion pathway protein J
LIEVLVALAVFGVLSVMAYMGLGQTLSNADMLGERMQRLEAIQRAIRYLDSDLMQAAPRPVRDLLGPPSMRLKLLTAAGPTLLVCPGVRCSAAPTGSRTEN